MQVKVINFKNKFHLISHSEIISFQSLFELELAGCNEITEAGLWACLTSRIVSLSLADCINVADEAVGAVAQLLPSLYEFSLQVSCYIMQKIYEIFLMLLSVSFFLGLSRHR